MSVSTAAGTKLYIGGTGSLESEAAWVEIGETTDLGEFGRVYAEITHSSIGDRNVRKFKGSRNDGNMVIGLGQDLSDDGQADVFAALDTDFDYNFKIEFNDAPPGTASTPGTATFKAKVMSFVTNIGGADSIVAASLTLGIQSGTITRTAPAAAP